MFFKYKMAFQCGRPLQGGSQLLNINNRCSKIEEKLSETILSLNNNVDKIKKETNSSISGLRNDIDDIKKETNSSISSLRNDIDDIKRIKAEAFRSNSSDISQIKKSLEELKSIKEIVDAMTKERDADRKKIDLLDSDIRETKKLFTESMEKIQTEFNSLKKKVDELAKEFTSMSVQIKETKEMFQDQKPREPLTQRSTVQKPTVQRRSTIQTLDKSLKSLSNISTKLKSKTMELPTTIMPTDAETVVFKRVADMRFYLTIQAPMSINGKRVYSFNKIYWNSKDCEALFTDWQYTKPFNLLFKQATFNGSVASMFASCTAEEITFEDCDFTNVENMSSFLEGCLSLKVLRFKRCQFNNYADTTNMLYRTNVKVLEISKDNVSFNGNRITLRVGEDYSYQRFSSKQEENNHVIISF